MSILTFNKSYTEHNLQFFRLIILNLQFCMVGNEFWGNIIIQIEGNLTLYKQALFINRKP